MAHRTRHAAPRDVVLGAAIHTAGWWAAFWIATAVSKSTSCRTPSDGMPAACGFAEFLVTYVVLVVLTEIVWTAWLLHRPGSSDEQLALAALVAVVAMVGPGLALGLLDGLLGVLAAIALTTGAPAGAIIATVHSRTMPLSDRGQA